MHYQSVLHKGTQSREEALGIPAGKKKQIKKKKKKEKGKKNLCTEKTKTRKGYIAVISVICPSISATN